MPNTVQMPRIPRAASTTTPPPPYPLPVDVVDTVLDNWSLPPFGGRADPGANLNPTISRDHGDQSIVLTQGVIYEVQLDWQTKFQNVSENEDDFIEWSEHGDPEGIWMKVDVGNILQVESTATLFLYNRTHKQNCIMSVNIG